jgi:hypothetical protein
MNGDAGVIAPLMQAFFADYLVRQRRVSPQTVSSYRDTFRLLLQYLSQTTGKKPSDLSLDDMQAKAILQFLDSIERDRGNSIQTRNARLAAIRSFFRLVALRDPARMDLAAQILSIPVKRAHRRLVGYLTRLEIEAILAIPNTRTWTARSGTGSRNAVRIRNASFSQMPLADSYRPTGANYILQQAVQRAIPFLSKPAGKASLSSCQQKLHGDAPPPIRCRYNGYRALARTRKSGDDPWLRSG